jgi:FkbM family methyltransferase
MTLPSYLKDDRVTLESVSRRDAQALMVGDGVALCRVLGKYLVYADTEDAGIVPHLCFSGYWESWITLAIARLVQPGWRCLDIGANHGYYTLLMADGVGTTGAVIAVEPNAKPAGLLRLTLSVNGLSRVEVVEKAASDYDGERLKLTIPAHFGLNAMLSDWRGEGTEAETVDVETTTVDSLTSGWPRVDLIKIAVEGSEEVVWYGMQDTVARNPDLVVILEVNANRYRDPKRFFSELERSGFPLRHINNDGDVTAISVDELATHRRGQDWMLFLKRSGARTPVAALGHAENPRDQVAARSRERRVTRSSLRENLARRRQAAPGQREEGPFIVVGSGRSGSSYVGGLLEASGIDMGAELKPPDRHNRKGYFEDEETTRMHLRWLARRGLTLESISESFPLDATPDECEEISAYVARREAMKARWGLKAPGILYFWDAWRERLPQRSIVLVPFRHPSAVAASFEQGGLNRELGLALWMQLNSLALRAADGPFETVFLDFDDRDGFNRALESVLGSYVDTFDAALIHETPDVETLPPGFRSLYVELSRRAS